MRRLLLAAFALLALSGCQNTYFNAMQSAGIDKHEMFQHRVEDARSSEDKARQQLRDTLDAYRRVVMIDSADLPQRVELFGNAQDASQKSIRSVHQRAENLQDVGEAWFADWKDDLTGYSDKGLQDASAAQRDNTMVRYQLLLQQLHSSEAGLTASLALFNDPQRLLGQNLGPQAIAKLKAGYPGIQTPVEQQVRDMQKTVDQCDALLRQLQAMP